MKRAKTAEEIEKLIEESRMVLLYIGSLNCSVCVSIRPKIENMLERFPKIRSVSAEAEISPEIAARFSVFSVPAVILFADKKETVRSARIINIAELENKIKRYYEMIFE
jgi:thioredoxin-like negative regulator of GroEL